VLFVGNLEPRKQVDVLLEAMPRVRQHVPNVVLLVVGSGESAGIDDQTARLHRLTRELGLETLVGFFGRVDDQQLLDCYAAAHVFALPSSSEAQGIAALEAMACGLPVVASAVGGLLGTIDDGITGFLVAPGNSQELAARLVRLLCDESLRSGMGSNARSAVEREFGWPRALAATIDLYREVLECRS
jgi:glycosyltransferase involved in cell wall biosynthesis